MDLGSSQFFQEDSDPELLGSSRHVLSEWWARAEKELLNGVTEKRGIDQYQK